jgi:hypothetical protein
VAVPESRFAPENTLMPKTSRPSRAWTANHFAQANPRGSRQADVPRLLRRVATTIAGLGAVEVADLVMHSELTDDGWWPSITVYTGPRSGTVAPRQGDIGAPWPGLRASRSPPQDRALSTGSGAPAPASSSTADAAVYTAKYRASGWCITIAAVDCSGTSW